MTAGGLRDIIEIDEEKCDGCGLCVPNCAEGALAIVDGKLRIVDDSRCDGAGACIGHCPRGALRIVRRSAVAFDEKYAAVPAASGLHMRPTPHSAHGAGGCPGSRAMSWGAKPASTERKTESQPSALTQWPVQLHLLSPNASFFEGRDLLLCADCVAFAAGDFHSQHLEGRSLAIACPKLDDTDGYVEKLATILKTHSIPALRVAIMEVPCCRGLAQMALLAARQADYRGEIELVTISRFGEVLDRTLVSPHSQRSQPSM